MYTLTYDSGMRSSFCSREEVFFIQKVLDKEVPLNLQGGKIFWKSLTTSSDGSIRSTETRQ